MSIHGGLYKQDVREVLQMFGLSNVKEIKEKLALRNIKIDETQILEALESLVKNRQARRADITGYYKI